MHPRTRHRRCYVGMLIRKHLLSVLEPVERLYAPFGIGLDHLHPLGSQNFVIPFPRFVLLDLLLGL